MVHLRKSHTFGTVNTSMSNQSTFSEVNKHYGDKIRVRACGVLIENDQILLLKHDGIGELGYFWSVPGGEPLKGETISNAVAREFLEEVNLEVEIEAYLHQNEYISPPLHAIELYFKVKRKKGIEQLGNDPETPDFKVISELKWFTKSEMLNLNKNCRPNFIDKLWN